MKNIIIKIMEEVIEIIRQEASDYVVTPKDSYKQGNSDLVTSADFRAQEHYVCKLKESFPFAGFIGEEGLNENTERPLRFVIDPLDGTKAFARNQSHGVGTMVAVMNGDKVIASFIGDVNTGDIYYFFGDEGVVRKRFGIEQKLQIDVSRGVEDYCSLATDPINSYRNKRLRLMLEHKKLGGLFRGTDVMGGSIGLLAARLLKDEVAILALLPYVKTPWDWNPVIGLLVSAGFVILEDNPSDETWKQVTAEPVFEVEQFDRHVVFVHQSNADEVLNFLNNG